MMGEEDWEEMQTVCEGTKANELYASFGAKYNDEEEIDYIELAFGLDIETVTVGHQSAVGGNGEGISSTVYEGQYVAVEYTIAFSEISEEMVVITLPNAVKNAGTYYEECRFCYEESTEVEKYYTKNGSSYYACPECAEEYICATCNQFVGYDYCCNIDGVRYCYDCCTHDKVGNREYEGQYILQYIQQYDYDLEDYITYNRGDEDGAFVLGENWDISVDIKYELDDTIYFMFTFEEDDGEYSAHIVCSGFIEIDETGALNFYMTAAHVDFNGEVSEEFLEEENAEYFGSARVFEGFMQLSECELFDDETIIGLKLANWTEDY